jgi:hypothetical protein
MTLRQLRLTHHPPHHLFQGYFQSQGHDSRFYWSSTWLALCGHLPPQVLMQIMRPIFFVAQLLNNFDRLNGLFDDTINEICHQVHAYATSNETFAYSGMLREEDHKHFFQAMEVELADHEEHNHWTLMERKDLPSGTKTIIAIWSFKQKQFSAGTLNKHKARLFAHGGQQTWSLDYWNTYAPVVTWASVCLLLIVAKLTVFNQRASILFWLFHKQIWMYQCIWNSLSASIPLMFPTTINIVMFSNSTKVFTVSSQLATIGLRSFEKD